MGLNRKNINKLLRDINSDNMNYTNFNNTHMINNFYTDETTKLIVNNSHIKIKTNLEYPSFLNDIKSMSNLFICDFINMDYFFLREIVSSRIKTNC